MDAPPKDATELPKIHVTSSLDAAAPILVTHTSSNTLTVVPTTVTTMPEKQKPPQRPFKVRPPVHIPPLNISERKGSSRAIKRKKFDDELVESSLAKYARRSSLTPTSPTSTTPASTTSTTVAKQSVKSEPDCSSSQPIRGTNRSRSVSSKLSTPATVAAPSRSRPPRSRPAPISHQKSTSKLLKAEKSLPHSTPPTLPTIKEEVSDNTSVKSEKISEVTAPTRVAAPSDSGKRRQPPKSGTLKARMKKMKCSVSKSSCRWKATDDLALILGVEQTNSLKAVFAGVNFSHKFTLADVEQRWFQLLYDETISTSSKTAMKDLDMAVVAEIRGQTLFTDKEEKILARVPASSKPSLDDFQKLLNENSEVFGLYRTPKVLFQHWQKMKTNLLLMDQTKTQVGKTDYVLHCSDAEDLINDDDLQEARDAAMERDLALNDRIHKREIRILENEAPKWQALVDQATGQPSQAFDSQTLATLRGRLVRYLMRSKEISLGRATANNCVDVDLSLEGSAWKVSRRQGMIKLNQDTWEFHIFNEGKHPIFVDGQPVLTGYKTQLVHDSVVEIESLRFIFLINKDLIAFKKSSEAQKLVKNFA